MNGKTILLLISFQFFVVIPIVGVASVQYLYGTTVNTLCDAGALVTLTDWMIASASVNIAYVLFGNLLLSIALNNPNSKPHKKALLTGGLIFLVWNIVWNIVGCISFFRDSGLCEVFERELWIVSWITIGLQWYLLVVPLTIIGATWERGVNSP